jgi:peptidoglycan/xylan/chitin deacetylase (PgdA/CDA1 family)
MLEPSSRYAARRAARHAQLRRRTAATGVLIAAAVVAAISLSSSSRSSSTSAPNARAGNSGQHPASGRTSNAQSTSERVGIATIQRLARLGRPIYCGGPRGNAVAFTFDDGPGPYTNLALNKLREANERATFFVVGRSMDHFPGYLPWELQLAAIGDHSYTHPLLSALSAAEITSQLARTKAKIEQDSGQAVTLFRPPYGGRNAVVDEVVKRLGLLDIIWTVDSADSLGAIYAGIIRNVEAGLRPGAIILMHENRGQTIRALTTLLPELHRRHLRSVSLPELFASDPPSVAQVMRGRAGCGVAARVPSSGG